MEDSRPRVTGRMSYTEGSGDGRKRPHFSPLLNFGKIY